MRFLYILWISLLFWQAPACGERLKTPFGSMKIEDPLLGEVLHSSFMERLKGITYLGAHSQLDSPLSYSTYDHMMGILYIIQDLNLSQQETINLLAPHFTSKALIRHPLKMEAQAASDQRSIQESLLKKNHLPGLLKTHKISFDEAMDRLYTHLRASSPFPHIIDQLEYIFHMSILKGKLTPQEAQEIIKDLEYEESQKILFFKTLASAQKVGTLSLELIHFQKEDPTPLALYHWLTQLMDHGIKQHIIILQDLYEKTDAEILRILGDTQDPILMALLEKMKDPKNQFSVLSDKDAHLASPSSVFFPMKYFPLNPWVQINSLELLTHIDSSFQEAYNLISEDQSGILIQLKE